MKNLMMAAIMTMAMVTVAQAEQIVDISAVGNKKTSVQVNVAHPMFAKCLKKNLEISGLFAVSGNGSVKVSGVPGAIRAEGSGKVVSCTTPFSDDKGARMAARKLSDDMCAAFGQQKGFALDKIVFLNRGRQQVKGSAFPGEICVCYPDGYDIRQLTSDAKMTVFPRWRADGQSIYYISDKNGSPQIWEMNTATGQRRTKWSFKGTPTGIAVSPDGSKVAAILSFQGNPELYVLQGDRFTRLTETKFASEGQPTWSPDGRKIAYVSNETKTPQIYVIDVATRQKRRLTSRGAQNVDPDWGKDGRIVYITKRAGSQIAVMSPADGDASAEVLEVSGNWEHPSWARDMRHVTANSGGNLYVVDTLPDGDKSRQIFSAKGNWISPSWVK